MCLIIYSPKGALVERSVAAYAHCQNSDGIGVMSVEGIEKFMGRKALKRAYRYIQTYLSPHETPYGLHFRWATHGDVKLANTHPYETPDGKHWVMHNGVISLTTAESSKNESDTAVFVRKYMDAIRPFDDKTYWTHIESLVNWGNKLLVMDDGGQFKICNEDAGVWVEGMWYSNTYSLPAAKIPVVNSGWYDRWYQRDRGEYQTADYYKEENYVRINGIRYHKDYLPKAYRSGNMSGVVIERADGTSATVSLLPAPAANTAEPQIGWESEDRRAYYEALESGLTPEQEAIYSDPGAGITVAEQTDTDRQTALALAVSDAIRNKEPAAIGGDFPEFPDDPDEDQTGDRFRRYLKAVARTIHVG